MLLFGVLVPTLFNHADNRERPSCDGVVLAAGKIRHVWSYSQYRAPGIHFLLIEAYGAKMGVFFSQQGVSLFGF